MSYCCVTINLVSGCHPQLAGAHNKIVNEADPRPYLFSTSTFRVSALLRGSGCASSLRCPCSLCCASSGRVRGCTGPFRLPSSTTTGGAIIIVGISISPGSLLWQTACSSLSCPTLFHLISLVKWPVLEGILGYELQFIVADVIGDHVARPCPYAPESTPREVFLMILLQLLKGFGHELVFF
jgi:hypothetical protein